MNLETELKESLASLMAAIRSSDSQQVAAAMDRVEVLLAQGRSVLPRQLVHFLENRSYAKALLLLGGDLGIPAGACGGRGGGH